MYRLPSYFYRDNLSIIYNIRLKNGPIKVYSQENTYTRLARWRQNAAGPPMATREPYRETATTAARCHGIANEHTVRQA